MKHTITLIPGDGIGPEVTEAVVRILNASGVQIEWEPQLAGVLALERTGHTLPVDLLDSIRRNKVALKGPVTTPIAEGFTSVNVGLRKRSEEHTSELQSQFHLVCRLLLEKKKKKKKNDKNRQQLL